MTNSRQFLPMAVLLVFWTGVSPDVITEDAWIIDADADNEITFDETRQAFGIDCCTLETADLVNAVTENLSEQHAVRVDSWSRFRSGLIDANADGKISFEETQRAFHETCCDVDLARIEIETRSRLVENHITRVERWSEFRANPLSENDES